MLFERLDARCLFATLNGFVWTDADASATFDGGERAIRNATVFLDANLNGRLDRGEATKTTDKAGRYGFKDLPEGDYLIGVVGPAGTGQTTPGPAGRVGGGFDIDLIGVANLRPIERQAFEAAAARWESVITGDLPNVGATDDVRINISVARIDGDGGTLAEAGPTRTRLNGSLPYAGEMTIDRDDVEDLIDEGHLIDTIAHEMAHVLGFGTIWADLNLLVGEGTRKPLFVGKEATRQYNAVFGTKATSVPVESSGGDGTADSHWPENAFSNEIMTGYGEGFGTTEPLSRVTVGAMADLGYTVNLAAADTWNPADGKSVAATPVSLGGRGYARRVTVERHSAVQNLNFGFRADTAPRIGSFKVDDGAIIGQDKIVLTADDITDAEGDAIFGVSFYRETNGVAGLQGGRGGDLYLGSDERGGAFGWSIADDHYEGIARGATTFYAVATDTLGLSGRRTAVGDLIFPPPPVRPNPVTATRVDRRSATLQWKDRADYELGFRVELLDDDRKLLRAFNVRADTRSAALAGLTRGVFYTARVRSYGYGGASAYTQTERFRV